MNLHTDTPLMATAEQRFRALVDLSPDAILIHAGGRFVYANQAAVTLLRAGSAQRILGLAPIELVAPECREQARERMQRVMRGESVPPIEMRWLRFDGTAVDVEASASALIDGEGISVQVFIRDITERKQAQRMRTPPCIEPRRWVATASGSSLPRSMLH